MTRTDISTRVLGRLSRAATDLVKAAALLRVRIRCRLWKIELGKGAIIHGMPVLYRTPDSVLSIGDGCVMLSVPWANFAGIDRPCTITTLHPGAVLRLGKRCGLSGTVISAAVSVTLGDDVLCGANTTIVDTDFHHLDPLRRNDHRDVPAAAVYIEDNVWLGMGSTVLKGVRIGRNSVIAAGSVVTRSIPADVVAGGIPARVLKSLHPTPGTDAPQRPPSAALSTPPPK